VVVGFMKGLNEPYHPRREHLQREMIQVVKDGRYMVLDSSSMCGRYTLQQNPH
jgi:hypothetical protein